MRVLMCPQTRIKHRFVCSIWNRTLRIVSINERTNQKKEKKTTSHQKQQQQHQKCRTVRQRRKNMIKWNKCVRRCLFIIVLFVRFPFLKFQKCLLTQHSLLCTRFAYMYKYVIHWSRAGAYLKYMCVFSLSYSFCFSFSLSFTIPVPSRVYLFIGNRRPTTILHDVLTSWAFFIRFARNICEWMKYTHTYGWLWFRFVAHEIINIFELKI